MNVANVVDGIIALLVIEMVTLAVYRRATRRGMPALEVLSFMGAGLALLIALRVLLAHGSFVLLGAALLVSLALHVWHVAQRWE